MATNGAHPKTADLAVISYEALVKKDADEIRKLVQASETAGVFYLDLTGPSTKEVLADIPVLYKSGAEFFRLPSEVKLESFREGLERGYKGGKGSETFEISRDESRSGNLVLPGVFAPQAAALSRVASICHAVTQHLLVLLADSLGMHIPEAQDFDSQPTDTGLKICYKAGDRDAGQVTSGQHTDFGLITLLFYDQETLQLPDTAREGEWLTVPVRGDGGFGFPVVNIADALAAKTGGRLHSPLHRVVAQPGPRKERYSVVYFLRPHKG